ncbi:X-Pro dipeptidyl-peptidase-domain-containing protein [Xylariales sp. PMI_506]|nr:X-Pro dipeptidyl-peptidase-domain-containing protein [Xylariales sp. PMI_506]
MAPVKRRFGGVLLDRCVAWLWGLPPESCTYTIESLRIPLGNAVDLAADLYRPLPAKSLRGTILVRSPYGIGTPMALGVARIYAARGYQVLMTACRGTGGSSTTPDSTGAAVEFRPAMDEAADGHAVIAWMRKQTWYTGSFATLGGSYLSYTQWAILSDPPADMKAAIINVGPHDWASCVWGTGALSNDTITWVDMITYMKKGGRIPPPIYFSMRRGGFSRVLGTGSLMDAIRTYFEGDVPSWFEQTLTTPDTADPFWQTVKTKDALERAKIPILIVAGWHDPFLEQSMRQYARLTERGCPVALTVGPWSHLEAQGGTLKLESLEWLSEHLDVSHTVSETSRKSAVRIFVTGAQEWRELPSWPPPNRTSHELFLGPAHHLLQEKATVDATDSVFTFDPVNPTPTIGVPTLDNMNGSKQDDAALAQRADVAAFTTEPLDRDLEIMGKPHIELHHSTNYPYADLLVRLCEVDPKGISHNISQRYLRLDVSRGTEPLQLDLVDCAHRFRKGFKIRVIVAGGSHPQFIRNMGVEDNMGTASTPRAVTHTIRHSASAASKLSLPAAVF